MKPEQEQAIKLEIFKAIMGRPSVYYPGQATIAQPGVYGGIVPGTYIATTALQAAQQVQSAFDAMFPKPTKITFTPKRRR